VIAGIAPTQWRVKANAAPHKGANFAAAAPKSEAPVIAASSSASGLAINIPHGDLTITEGKIVRIIAKVGQKVKAGEAVLEMETEKSVVQVEAPADGTVSEILVQEGAVVQLGQRVGTLEQA
jgi:2-oxoisovalerate dehydrogenase E1 component